jgi:hypothetical protein
MDIRDELAEIIRSGAVDDIGYGQIADRILARFHVAEWRPIEEASKDGTPVDLWVKPLAGSSYRLADMRWVDDGWRSISEWGDIAMGETLTPLFWMPLPPDPTPRSGDRI